MDTSNYSISVLKERLFSLTDIVNHNHSKKLTEQSYTYAIVNGAGNDKVIMNIGIYQPESQNLYYPDEADELEDAAPWLVKLEDGEPFTEWLFKKCFNKRLLLFIQSDEEIEALAEHFRHFTKAEIPNKDEQGNESWQIAYFSFYDPTSFSTWVKSLTEEEAIDFFQPIINVWYEDKRQQKLKLIYMSKKGWETKAYPIKEEKQLSNNTEVNA